MRVTSLLAAATSSALLISSPPAHASSAVPNATTKMAKAINKYRDRHQAPPLGVSNSLKKSAQKWADRGVFEHSKGKKYGENLYAANVTCTEDVIRRAVSAWYSEADKYHYDYKHPDTAKADKKEFDKGVGHFTQMVWKSSKKLGVGVASHPNKKWKCLVVAQFSPPGNYMGKFRENVRPPK